MNDEDFDYEAEAVSIWSKLNSSERECMLQFWKQGPVYDGYVISKTIRDKLLDMKLIVKISLGAAGGDGYQALTYLGHRVYKYGTQHEGEKR